VEIEDRVLFLPRVHSHVLHSRDVSLFRPLPLNPCGRRVGGRFDDGVIALPQPSAGSDFFFFVLSGSLFGPAGSGTFSHLFLRQLAAGLGARTR